VQHQRTKHIEMDIHFVREKVVHGQAGTRPSCSVQTPDCRHIHQRPSSHSP
jgi:hypothetical protein